MASVSDVSKRTALSPAHSRLAAAHRSSFWTTSPTSRPSDSQVTSSEGNAAAVLDLSLHRRAFDSIEDGKRLVLPPISNTTGVDAGVRAETEKGRRDDGRGGLAGSGRRVRRRAGWVGGTFGVCLCERTSNDRGHE